MKFFMPVKIYSGSDIVPKQGEDIAAVGNKAIIVTGRSSGEKSGALRDITDVLKKHGKEYVIFDGVLNNPTVENCYEAGNIAKKEGADFVIGIGGGSPLDAAKAVAVFATNDIAPMDIFKNVYDNKPLPIIAVPTTAGTGSEVTPYAVLTVVNEETKRSFNSEFAFPKLAFLDAKYTKALPKSVTINTAVDAMSHAIESILNKRSTILSEHYAYEALHLLGKAFKDMDNMRQELLLASTLAGVAIAQTGTAIVHSMGYPLTYFKDIAHGRANGLLLAEFVSRADNTDRIFKELNISGIGEFKEMLNEMLEPSEEFTIDELKSYAAQTIGAKNVASNPYPVTEEIQFEIYKNSLKTKE